MLHIVKAQRFGFQINHQGMGYGRIGVDVDRLAGRLRSHRFAPGPQRVVINRPDQHGLYMSLQASW